MEQSTSQFSIRDLFMLVTTGAFTLGLILRGSDWNVWSSYLLLLPFGIFASLSLHLVFVGRVISQNPTGWVSALNGGYLGFIIGFPIAGMAMTMSSSLLVPLLVIYSISVSAAAIAAYLTRIRTKNQS